MGCYDNGADAPYMPVYREDEVEQVINEPDLLIPLVFLREIYRDYPVEKVAEYLHCEQVSEPEYHGQQNVLIRLRYRSKKRSGVSLNFCMYRNGSKDEHFFSVAWGEKTAPFLSKTDNSRSAA